MKNNYIKEIRKSKKIKRVELAKKSKVTVTELYYIENGIHSPTFRTLQKIAKALDVDIIELISKKGDKKNV